MRSPRHISISGTSPTRPKGVVRVNAQTDTDPDMSNESPTNGA